MKYIVIKAHRSEYPDPVRLKKGDLFAVGKKYEGPEAWEGWYFCATPSHAGGWVPRQVIELLDGGTGRALEDYSAQELNVDKGEVLFGERTLNGWVWCRRPHKAEAGWVPLENLQSMQG